MEEASKSGEEGREGGREGGREREREREREGRGGEGKGKNKKKERAEGREEERSSGKRKGGSEGLHTHLIEVADSAGVDCPHKCPNVTNPTTQTTTNSWAKEEQVCVWGGVQSHGS